MDPINDLQLVTPYDMVRGGLVTNSSYVTDSSLDLNMSNNTTVLTIAKELALGMWNTKSNYNTRMVTTYDVDYAVNYDGDDPYPFCFRLYDYEENLCVPFGPMRTALFDSITWEDELVTFPYFNEDANGYNSNYDNYGYVNVYVYSPYYFMRSWYAPSLFELVCWNGNTSSPVGDVCYINRYMDTVQSLLDENRYLHYGIYSWDGEYIKIMSTPWFCDSGITSSKAYLSLFEVGGSTPEGCILDFNTYYITYSTTKLSKLSTITGYTTYKIHNAVKVGSNGKTINLYIQ